MLMTAGNLLPYLASYMHKRVSETIGHAELQWVGSTGQVAFGLCSVLGGLMEKRIGTRIACLVGAIIMGYTSGSHII